MEISLRKHIVLGLSFTGLAVCALVFLGGNKSTREQITKRSIAGAVEASVNADTFPSAIEIPGELGSQRLQVTYTLDERLQDQVRRQFRLHRPDYGSFVAIDPKTGRVKALVNYAAGSHELGNLALRATFPAASIFKIVTAAAAIDTNRAEPDTVIEFNGGMHSLYRGNVLSTHTNRWTNRMTLKQAFAQSVNTVFGKIGAFLLEPPSLSEYAYRFAFNKRISSDIPIDIGSVEFPDQDDLYGRAELASGFNRVSLMSPLQGAMIAAAIANDGDMMEPFIVEMLTTQAGAERYVGVPRSMGETVAVSTAHALQELMRETIVRGTSRQAFRSLVVRDAYSDIEVGGKTGSLTGLHPRGRCDWFVGYASRGEEQLAVAALTVNRDQWRMKSSWLARYSIEKYFSPD